jgi:hypothetical protein
MKRLLALSLLCACTRTSELVSPVDAGRPYVASEGGVVALCGTVACQCSNGVDDDHDGLTDGLDPECTAPFDNDENTFATGVHGEGQDKKCQDCFFDGDSNSACKRARSCALDGTTSSGTGACRSCSVGPSCSDSCLPRVPNGCDCFGCCQVWHNGIRAATVLLEASCTLAELGDPTKCVPCTQAPDCLNTCGECELCTGRSLADLPPSCDAATCEGALSCASNADCPALTYCQQGCCLTVGY